MTRKEIRKVLKKWIAREKTEYNHLYYTFTDIRLSHKPEVNPFHTYMTPVFESLVDEVYNMIQEEKNEEKDRQYKG